LQVEDQRSTTVPRNQLVAGASHPSPLYDVPSAPHLDMLPHTSSFPNPSGWAGLPSKPAAVRERAL